MQIDGLEYYNHAANPSTAPHDSANIEPIIMEIFGELGRVLQVKCEIQTTIWISGENAVFN